MFILAFISMLLLQLWVYTASYFVTRSLVHKKFHHAISPLSSYKFHVILLGISLGSILSVYFGFYMAITVFTGLTLGLSAMLWLLLKDSV